MTVMTINGEGVETAGSFGVINPATGQVHAQAPECSREQLDAAMTAAQDAYVEWRRDDEVRRTALRKMAELLTGAADRLAPIITAEQGMPLGNAAMEAYAGATWLKYYADLEIAPEVVQDDDAVRIEVVRRPLGVVAAITPWNFPLTLAMWKVGPALRAGNTLVLKPSPYTPMATLEVGRLLQEALPPGVFNVVSGGDDLGAWMTSHPVPRKVSFTGSVATGKKVAMSAAPDLKRVTLELGGNDAAIVLDDADPAAIADKLFWGAFYNSGQVCAAVKRAYVADAVYDDVLEALAERARTVSMGDGTLDGVRLGPINNRPQFERVSGLVADALSHGARAVAGGHARPGEGYFFEPTILTDISDGVAIVDEEQFGPALPVIRYTDVDDALRRANSGNFGLGGSVWSSDPQRAADVAARMECGSAWVNAHTALAPNLPFGGLKWSGLGVENGPWGLYGFTELQVLHRPKG
jgi:acyl-CoA reductase-like NAD-dependent aldehyde dehydrogenase